MKTSSKYFGLAVGS